MKLEGEFMLVKDETKYCWVLGEYAGEPQDSIKDAIEDFIKTHSEVYEIGDSDHSYMCDCYMPHKQVKIGHPYYYVPTVDADRVIEDIVEIDLDDEIAEWSQDYLVYVKQEHIDELQKELTAVFRRWEKRHNYQNTAWVVLVTKTYLINDYMKE